MEIKVLSAADAAVLDHVALEVFDEPIDPARIDRAYARFLRQGASAPARWRGPRLVRYAALAVVTAVGSVYAATLIRPLAAPQLPEARPPAEAPTSPPRAMSPPRLAMELGEAASEEADPSSEAETPPAAASPVPKTVREQPVRSPAPVPSAEQWRRAAQGLRDGDYQSADAALKELTRRGTEADRESALLVQAQVLLAQGRDAEAQKLLRSLAASARAPSVRSKSVELLSRIRDRPAARPSKARVVTEPP